MMQMTARVRADVAGKRKGGTVGSSLILGALGMFFAFDYAVSSRWMATFIIAIPVAYFLRSAFIALRGRHRCSTKVLIRSDSRRITVFLPGTFATGKDELIDQVFVARRENIGQVSVSERGLVSISSKEFLLIVSRNHVIVSQEIVRDARVEFTVAPESRETVRGFIAEAPCPLVGQPSA